MAVSFVYLQFKQCVSSVHRHLVRREELRPGRHAVLLGEESEQAVADLELFNHSTEARGSTSVCAHFSQSKRAGATHP